MALAALGLVVAIAWLAARDRGGDEPHATSATPSRPAQAPAPASVESAASRAAALGAGSVRTAEPAQAESPTSPSRYEGTGRIKVLATARGAAFPRAWTLVLEPSRSLIGGTHAAPRRFDFSNGEREVEVEVALGAYDVSAAAAGMCSQAEPVWLARPDSLYVLIHVELYPAGTLTGRVVDANGAPVAGLRVVVVPLAPRGDAGRREAITDPAGQYAFESLLDGEYRLAAGDERAPMGEARELSFVAPSLHMPDLAVPELGSIDVRVVDSSGKPVAEADVAAFGTLGLPPPVTTDRDGRARIQNLVPGPVSLVAKHSTLGEGRARATVAIEAVGVADIALRP